MEKYNIELADQVYVSLDTIYEHKNKYDENYAIGFVGGFFEEVKKLEYLPHRGFNMAGDNKAHVYKGHLIIYHIQEPELVLIIDIIDSRQDSIAKRYY